MPRSRRYLVVAGLTGLCLAAAGAPALAAPGSPAAGVPLTGIAAKQAAQHATPSKRGAAAGQVTPADTGGGEQEGEGDPLEVADQAEQYAGERSAPADDVSAAALLAARAQAAAIPQAPASTAELTTVPYQAEPRGYTDPVWSNAGAGFGIISGRTTALATRGTTYYAGTADGGVWKSVDAGATWRSVWDAQPTLSIGSVMIGATGDVWVGTGEANTSSDSYQGTGVYRSTDGGRTFARVGGTELVDHTSFRLLADGAGHVYDATNAGLFRHGDSATGGAWTLVLKPDPNPTGSPYDTSFITDVAVKPGTRGQTVVAALGWRGGTSYNGFYVSTLGGGAGSFSKATLTGAIDAGDIGRTTFGYAADGSRLYAIVQSPEALNGGEDSNLQGVYVSANGDPTGPWTLVADSAKLGASGSALGDMDGYHVGIQSWYNQAIAVDPANPLHVFVSLEEVFTTTDGGATFTTASPYWNYGLACGTACPKTTHPDQHALALSTDGRVVIGNDGGVYSRSASLTGYGHWSSLNATLRTLQYYDAQGGATRSGTAYWGGLQDNGNSLLLPGASQMVEPAGGDGGEVLVDPNDANRAVLEYTNLDMYRTADGGRSFTEISPMCGPNPAANCDPSSRFIAPFAADTHDTSHWVAAGSKVWDTRAGFNTVCKTTCDWKPVHSFGKDAAGGRNVGTAVAVSGVTTYAAWVDSGANPSPSFASGIDTNYGGTWHRISSPVLPNRFISAVTVDPANPAHVYAVYNGYSRRWIPGGGLGTVFESSDGGSTWRNISGNLPDAPGDGLAVVGGSLVLGTDVGAFVASASAPTRWSRVAGLPNVVVDNVRTQPGSTDTVLAATHGRGLWTVRLR